MNADDLLRKVLDVWDDDLILDDALSLMRDIRAYLDAPKDEPVAWRLRPPPRLEQEGDFLWYFNDDPQAEKEMKAKGWTVEPLYLRPPTKTAPIGYVFQYSDGVLGSDIYYTPEEAVEYTEGEGIGVPVYRDPPTKTAPGEPMTVEEMRKAWDDPEELTQQCLIDYCRAIEKHHGIGDKHE